MEQRATNGGGDISPATQRLIAQLERLVADASRPSMKVPLLQRLAKTWERRAGRMEEALACVALAVALAPSDRRSRADMDRLVDEISDVESLEAAWERALGRADDDKTRNELMAQLARLLEERGETGRALARYENAVAAGLDDLVTLEGAARAFRHAGRWPQLADVLERLLDRSDGGDEKGERLKALADVYELQLHEPSRALFALESARADLGDTPELLLALDRLYESTGQPRPRVEILRQLAVLDPKEAAGHLSRALGLVDGLAEGTDDGDALTELRVHKAELLETAGDGAGAMSVLQDVLDADPDNRHALSVLGRLHFDEQRWEAAAPLLQQELAFLGESDEPAYRAELHRRSARCAVQSGDSALAAEHFDNANQLVPGELTTLLGLARAKRRLGRESEAHEHFESLLRLEGSEARTPIGREIRMAFLELELEPLRRLSLSEEILTNQGSNRTAARLRVESLLDLDRWSDGAEALAALIEDTEKAGSFDMSHLMSDLMRLSGLQREHLGISMRPRRRWRRSPSDIQRRVRPCVRCWSCRSSAGRRMQLWTPWSGSCRSW